MPLKIRIPLIVFVLGVCAILGVLFYRAYAAEITNVKITNITDTEATIQWSTDTNTDATVNFGLDERVGVVRDPNFDKKEHSLTIDRLDPLTTYHFRVISADEEGNKSATAGFAFTTKNSEVPNLKIKKQIEKVKDPEELKKLEEQIKEQIEILVQPPSIIGSPKVVVNDSDRATITWSTDRESNSVVYLAPEGEYQEGSAEPYSITQGNPRELTTKHEVEVTGLEPNTVYHFSVYAEDAAGLSSSSEDDTFRTMATLPVIGNVRVTRVQETSAQIAWNTGNVKAKGIVEFTNTKTRQTKVTGNPVYATNHTVQLLDLEFGVRYTAIIRATNEAGDEISSAPVSFITVRDRVAPEISKVNNESTLYPGEEVKIQTIISWVTDEPSYCQVFYAQGLARADGELGDSLPKEENPDTVHTQVIVGFASATVYQFWMFCNDEAGNESRSEDFVLITPVKEKSIIDIILENFEGTFGWVKNIGG